MNIKLPTINVNKHQFKLNHVKQYKILKTD